MCFATLYRVQRRSGGVVYVCAGLANPVSKQTEKGLVLKAQHISQDFEDRPDMYKGGFLC